MLFRSQAENPWPDYFIKNVEKNDKETNRNSTNKLPSNASQNIELITEVTLYKFNKENLFISSYAYFENNDFIIDYGKISGDYEDEYFIKVKNESLVDLYNKMNIVPNNKTELLKSILIRFSGIDSFQKFEFFLKENNLIYEYNVRHA